MTTRAHEDPEVPKPLYQRIADELRDRIKNGELSPGSRLPTERDLAEQWSAARGTVRRATETLRNEGLVLGSPPRGVFVRGRKRIVVRPQEEFGRHFASLTDFFVDQVRAQQGEPSQIIKVEHIRPPVVVAERLRTGDAVVVARTRIRSVDGERYDLNDSYYPADVVEGSEVMSPDDITRGVNKLLDERGHEQVLMVDELVARMPTKIESDLLDLPPATPVLEQIVTGYLGIRPDSRPVRCAVTVYPGDRYRLVYERRRQVQE